MTMREMLRAEADDCEKWAKANVWMTASWGPKQMLERAAALRALADRMDHEVRWAEDIERTSQNDPRTRHAAIIVQGVLARLDAAPLAPREPEAVTAEHVNGGPLACDSKFFPGQLVTATVAPREPEVKACSHECPNNPGRQCIDFSASGQQLSGRCVFKCAIDNDRDAEPEVKACEPWCGSSLSALAGREFALRWWTEPGETEPIYCTRACRDAAAQLGGKRP